MYWYFEYVTLYTIFAAAIIVERRAEFARLVRTYPAVAAFLVLYAVVYVFGIAFYEPISGTGTTRFLLAHVLPYLFAVSLFVDREPFCRTEWTLGGTRVSARHVHLLVARCSRSIWRSPSGRA